MHPSTQTTPDISIHYEDEDLIIVDKPANLLSQKDHTGNTDLTTLIKQYLTNETRSSKTPYLGLLHRLDRPVSGLIMLAKSSRMASECSQMMNNQTIDKTYLAIIHGKAAVNNYLEHYLVKDHQKNIVKVTDQNAKHAKRAILTFQRLSYNSSKDLSLLKVHLMTGRSHQIRVQLAAEELPVMYDQKYSPHSYTGSSSSQHKPIALKSSMLRFHHPFTGEEITCRALPDINATPWSYFHDELSSIY